MLESLFRIHILIVGKVFNDSLSNVFWIAQPAEVFLPEPQEEDQNGEGAVEGDEMLTDEQKLALFEAQATTYVSTVSINCYDQLNQGRNRI